MNRELEKGGYIHAKGIDSPERGEEVVKLFRQHLESGNVLFSGLRPGESVELVLPPKTDPDIFSIVEAIIIVLYDGNLLTLAGLDAIGNTWRGYEMLPQIDEGDSGNNVMTNDGLYLSDIALDLIEPGFSPETEAHSWDRFVEASRSRWGWK